MKCLGLFVLLLVGVMLFAEGGHIAHLAFFGYPIEPMAKSTFYFVVAALVIVDIIQGRYQKKIMLEETAAFAGLGSALPFGRGSAKPRGIHLISVQAKSLHGASIHLSYAGPFEVLCGRQKGSR